MALDICYGLGLHMHQPPENLELLVEHNEWEAHQIIRCYERAARYAHEYADVGKFHVGFSGVLLEQFKDPKIIDKYRRYVDIPAMLDAYRTADAIEVIGMGYYHPIFPLIPQEDWADQLKMGRDIIEELFGKSPKGFWPPEMAFTMEMVPALVQAGYEYVVVDHVHVQPEECDDERPDCFQPYKAVYDGAEITVIPRNRDISNAQESGLNPQWFMEEVEHKVFDYPNSGSTRLVTTWSDGENGGWFRQMDEANGFFGFFYAPLMEMIRDGACLIKPVHFSEFLKDHHPSHKAFVKTGAWNVASTSGYDFSQWNGSESQKKAIEELIQVSARYWDLTKKELDQAGKERLVRARNVILEAETSCYLFWGEAWLPKLYEKLQEIRQLLD